MHGMQRAAAHLLFGPALLLRRKQRFARRQQPILQRRQLVRVTLAQPQRRAPVILAKRTQQPRRLQGGHCMCCVVAQCSAARARLSAARLQAAVLCCVMPRRASMQCTHKHSAVNALAVS